MPRAFYLYDCFFIGTMIYTALGTVYLFNTLLVCTDKEWEGKILKKNYIFGVNSFGGGFCLATSTLMRGLQISIASRSIIVRNYNIIITSFNKGRIGRGKWDNTKLQGH